MILIGVDKVDTVIWANPTALTGQLLVLVLFLMTTSALSAVRRTFFEQFWFTHHLYILYFPLLLLHGSFCFIKMDGQPVCGAAASFWEYLILGGTIFLTERFIREYRAYHPARISKVIQHPSNVIEIQLKKNGFSMCPGQYIFIACPEIATYQWHPFTLTSSPDEKFFSVHMRVVGDWTGAMAKRLGCEWDSKGLPINTASVKGINAVRSLPMILVDGPFGASR
jgi:predicted ferric reductase